MVSPTLYAVHCHVKPYVHEDEEMAFNYTEVLVFLALATHPEKVLLTL